MSKTPFTRVAVVQLDYHPAAIYDGRAIIDDPLGELRETIEVPANADLSERRSALRKRIREAYVDALMVKLRAILRACTSWGVEVLVFPEYSIPWQALEQVVAETANAPKMLVVAGTHAVSRSARSVYERLEWPRESTPAVETPVAPVIRGGKLLALVGKLAPSKIEEGSKSFKASQAWKPVPMGNDLGSLAVIICIDFLHHEDANHQALVLPELPNVRLYAVPSLTPRHSWEKFAARGREQAAGYKRPVLFANIARHGGSTTFVDDDSRAHAQAFPWSIATFEAGEEGVSVADIDLGFVRTGPSTSYDASRPVRPVAAVSLVYRHTAESNEYAEWVLRFSEQFEQEGADVEQAIKELENAKAMLMRVAELGDSPSRSARLRSLFEGDFEYVGIDRIRELTREIVLPEGTLPLPWVRHGLVHGARQAVLGWRHEHEVGLDATLLRLSDALRAKPKEALLPAAERALGELVGRIREGEEDDGNGARGRHDLAIEVLVSELRVESEELERRLEAGHLHEAEIELRRKIGALEKVLESHERADHEGAENLQGLRLHHAGVLLNQQRVDDAKLVLASIDEAALNTDQKSRLARLWAVAGEPARARLVIQSIPSDAQPSDLTFTQARISIAEGEVPSPLPEDARILVPAAWLQLQRGVVAEAARLVIRALDLSPPSTMSALGSYVLLVGALHATIWEESWVLTPIPTEERAEVIVRIEQLRRAHLGAWATIVGQPNGEQLAIVLRNAVLAHRDAIFETDPWPELATPDEEHAEVERGATRLAERGEVEEGLSLFEPTDRPWDREMKRAHLLLIAGRLDEAREASQALVARYPHRAPLERLAAIVLYEARDYDRALEHAQQAFEQVPAGGYLLLLGKCFVVCRRHDDAWKYLQGAWRSAGPALLELAAVVADRVRAAEAHQVWERHVELVPHAVWNRMLWARALFHANELDRAATVAWEAHELCHSGQSSLEEMTPTTLGLIARFQRRSLVVSPEAKHRIELILEELQQRFPRSPEAEVLRMQLSLAIGKETSVDVPLLVDAGVAQSIAWNELPQWLALVEHMATARKQLYEQGGISLVGLLDAEDAHYASSLVERWNAPRRHFCAPSPISDGKPLRLEKSELVVGPIELLLLAKLRLFESLHSLAERLELRLLVLEHDERALRQQHLGRMPRYDEDPEVERLTTTVDAWIGTEALVQIVPTRSFEGIPKLPPLRFEGEIYEDLLRAPLEARLAQAAVIYAGPGRRLLTADYFGTTGIGSVDLGLAYRWQTPGQFQHVTQFLERAGSGLVTLPELVRIMAREGVISEQRRRDLLIELAIQGFGDALDGFDLAWVAVQMEPQQRDRCFAGLESLARVGGRSCAFWGRYALASRLSKAIIAGCLGEDGSRRPRRASVLSMPSERPRAFPPEARAELLLTLLDRAYELDKTSGDTLYTTLVFVALETVERLEAAFLPDHEDSMRVLDEKSPVGKLWTLLGEWAGQDDVRRAALDRAVCGAWVALDRQSPAEGPGLRCLPLVLAETTKREVGHMSVAHECIAILSANWPKRGERPLTKLGLYFTPNDPTGLDSEVVVFWEDVLEHAATKTDPLAWRGGDRRTIVVDYDGGALSSPLRLHVPIEAVVLRMPPDRMAAGISFALEIQGSQDGIAHEWLRKLQQTPTDLSLRRAYAQHAAIAPWRQVREDPAFLRRWILEFDIGSQAVNDLETLRRMLHEPSDAIQEDRASEVWPARAKGAWKDLDAATRGWLAEHLATMPGLHGILSRPNLADRDELGRAVELALKQVEHTDSFPAGNLASNIRLLHAVAAYVPVVELRRGAVDLRVHLPSIILKALDLLESPTRSMGKHEPALLRACAQVVQRALEHRPNVGPRDYLWLTHRLHAWLCDQLRFIAPDTRARGIERLANLAAPESAEHGLALPELFDPFRFEAHGFDYRRAVFLSALITGLEIVHREAGSENEFAFTSPELERRMLELAERPVTQEYVLRESWIDWPLPVTVPNLAAYWLLRTNTQRFFTMAPELLIRHVERWPTELGTLRAGDWALIGTMASDVAMRVHELPDGVVDAFARKLDSLIEDTPGRNVLWMGLTGLFARGAVELRDRARSLVDEHVGHKLAPFFVGLFFSGIIGVGPHLLTSEIDRLLDKATEVPSIHMTVFAALARLVIHAKAPDRAHIARAALESLAQRSELCDDPGLKAILAYLPAPTPPTPSREPSVSTSTPRSRVA